MRVSVLVFLETRGMHITLVTPVPPDAVLGNAVTACRWADLLTELGHRVELTTSYSEGRGDLLIALHARRSADSVARFHTLHPSAAIIVCLAGTDLYRDIKSSREAQRTLDIASRLVVLQPRALDDLPSHLHEKTRVIHQSSLAPPKRAPREPDSFQVCVLAHLRDIKDPLRAARAARLLPPTSRTRVLHAGRALNDDAAEQARAEAETNPRYRWLEELSRAQSQALLTASHLLVISSTMEGGANVVSEALAASVPIVATRIPGNLGTLGEDYPGYFPVGNTEELARLLLSAETDQTFYEQLAAAGRRLAQLVDPAREKAAWQKLLSEFPDLPAGAT